MFDVIKYSKFKKKEKCFYIHGWTDINADKKLIAKVYENRVHFIKIEYTNDDKIINLAKELKKKMNNRTI